MLIKCLSSYCLRTHISNVCNHTCLFLTPKTVPPINLPNSNFNLPN